MIQHRKPADYVHMPWKNGNGSTTQIAIYPEHATLDDFDWRISSATINQASDFSRFVGVDRSLAILSGAGLRLGNNLELTPQSPPYCFTGEQAITADLINGTVVDFNVMTRRQNYAHTFKILHIEGEAFIRTAIHETVILFHAHGETLFINPHHSLDVGETLIMTEHQAADIAVVSHDALLYVIHIQKNL